MRLNLDLLPLIGAAPVTGEAADPDREITESDPAVVADDELLDCAGVLFGMALLAEPFAPKPELLVTERELIDVHVINARDKFRPPAPPDRSVA